MPIELDPPDGGGPSSSDKAPELSDPLRGPEATPNGDEAGMLDIPLGERTPNDHRSSTEKGSSDEEPRRSVQRRQRTARPAKKRSRWWLLALAALAVVGGYFLPRPAPPVLRLSTASVDFGALRVTHVSEPATISVANGGSRKLEIVGLELDGDTRDEFQISREDCVGAVLEEGMSCSVELLFEPAEAGPRQAVVIVSSNATNSPVELPLRGAGTAPELHLDRRAISFKPQELGAEPRAEALILTNKGSAELEFGEVSIEGGSATEFRLAMEGCTGAVLESASSCRIEVIFVPRLEGQRVATVRIRSDAPGKAVEVSLKGKAKPRSLVTDAPPTGLVFERQAVAVDSRPLKLVLISRSDHPLEIDSVSPAGGSRAFRVDAAECTSEPLEPNTSCPVAVVFRPRSGGTVSDQLAVVHSSGEVRFQVTVSGRGFQPRMDVGPENLEFRSVRVGRESRIQALRVRNTGEGDLPIGSVELEGQDRSHFSISADQCAGTSLLRDAVCEVGVTYGPGDATSHEARVVVRLADEQSESRVGLSGRGVAPRLQVEPAVIDFGPIDFVSRSTRRLTVTNSGNATMTLLKLGVAGDGANDFHIVDSTCRVGSSLAPAARCTVTVRLVPTEPGARSALLELESDGVEDPAPLVLRAVVGPRPRPELAISPRTVVFPTQIPGGRSSIIAIRISNPGTGRLVLESVQLSGEHPEEFSIVPGSCAGAGFVAPGADCTIGLRFVPSQVGESRAQLRLLHNAQEGEDSVGLSGTAVDPPPAGSDG